MRTWQLAALVLLTTLCATANPSSGETIPFERTPNIVRDRLNMIRERSVSLYEVSVTSDSCANEIRRFARHVLPVETEERKELALFIGIPANPATLCTFLRARDVDTQTLRRASRAFEKNLRQNGRAEPALVELFEELDIEFPKKDSPATVPSPPLQVIPLLPATQEPVSYPNRTTLVPLRRLNTEMPATKQRRELDKRLVFGAIGMMLGALALFIYLFKKRPLKRPTASSPSILHELSDDELLAKQGLGGQDLQKLVSSGAYERIFREKLYRAGARLFLLDTLAEAAEERYPELWRSVRGKINKARNLYAKEIDARHMDIVFNRQNKDLRERMVNVCRALDLSSSICMIIFEAFDGELESRFKAFALVREFYEQTEMCRARAPALPPQQSKALLKVLENYRKLAEHVMREHVRTWSGAYLGLETLRNEILELAKERGAAQPPVPEPISEPPTQRIKPPKHDKPAQTATSALPTIVPAGN